MKDALDSLGLPSDDAHLTEANLEAAWSHISGTPVKMPLSGQQALAQTRAQNQPPAKPVQTGLSDRPDDAPLPPVESMQSIAQKIQTLAMEQRRLYIQQMMQRERQKQQR